MLQNIYEAFGSLSFKYHGKIMHVAKNDETGQYELVGGNA